MGRNTGPRNINKITRLQKEAKEDIHIFHQFTFSSVIFHQFTISSMKLLKSVVGDGRALTFRVPRRSEWMYPQTQQTTLNHVAISDVYMYISTCKNKIVSFWIMPYKYWNMSWNIQQNNTNSNNCLRSFWALWSPAQSPLNWLWLYAGRFFFFEGSFWTCIGNTF